MKEKITRALLLSLSSFLAFTPLSTLARESESSRSAFEEITKQMNPSGTGMELLGLNTNYPVSINSEKSLKTADSLPEKFDLRSIDKDGDGIAENYVSSIKRQNPWGTCWTFGTMAALEATLAYQYDTPVEEGNELDLSEHHLAYFTYSPMPEDEYYGQGGEGIYFAKDEKNKEMTGGQPGYATSLFSSGMGPVYERDCPYWGKEKLVGNNKRHLIKDGKVYDEQGNVLEGESTQPDCYWAGDDWSLDEAQRFGTYFELRSGNMLPQSCIVTRNADGSAQKITLNEPGIEAIKSELVNGRAVAVTFHADQSLPEQGLDNSEYINLNTWAQYTYDGPMPNHMVCIVGYDDTYPKENFLSGHQPEKDGAWIVKNSWGEKNTTFPNKREWGLDGSGYFYLSYYDTSIQNPESFEFVRRDLSEQKQYHIGQYDYMPSSTSPDNSSQSPMSMANVFKASDDLLIHSLSAQSASANTTITYDLYRLNKDYKNPKDGELLESQTIFYPYAGYHRIDLNKSYPFAKGSGISVVVTIQRADGRYELDYDMGMSEIQAKVLGLLYPDELPNPSWAQGVINKGESFMSDLTDQGEVWKDWGDHVKELSAISMATIKEAGFLDALENQDAQAAALATTKPVNSFALSSYDNFPIKFYADFIEDDIPFKDLGLDTENQHWALLSGDIPAVLSKGLMTGKSESVFGADDALKRAEAAMTLFRLSGESDPEKIAAYSGPSTFKDVNISAWYGPAMNWAAQNGIFVGSNGCVRPDDPISRQELATILYRYAQKTGAANNSSNNNRNQIKTASSYLDAPDAKDVSNWAREGMAWAYENGLITGYQPSGNLLPKGETKRGEYAKILLAFLDTLQA